MPARKKGSRSPPRKADREPRDRPLLGAVHPQPRTAYEWFVNAATYLAEREAGERFSGAVAQWARCRRALPSACVFGGTAEEAAAARAALLDWLNADWLAAHPQGPPAAPLREEDVPGGAEWADRRGGYSGGAAEAAAGAAPDSDAEPAPPPEPEEAEAEEADDPAVAPRFADRYWGGGVWLGEQGGAGAVESWSCAEVEEFIRDVGRRIAKQGKYEALFAGFAHSAANAGWDGKMLLAANPALLAELVLGMAGTGRWPEGLIKIQAGKVWDELAKMSGSKAEYWGRARSLQQTFSAREEVAAVLRGCLQPQPREAVRYCLLRCRGVQDGELAVDAVEDDVSHFAGPGPERFKVVSVCRADDPCRVVHNFVYARDSASRWQLFCSVDFAQHGEGAPPGHWHVNRAPLGELVPHWGPSGEVWHGAPEGCPVWWHLIPEGTTYFGRPERRPLYDWTR
eukprot:TRINITY_DN65942_c0_g1_i1.p1 TRINITY_DN65942_c0_g1~~TRINITY_DN65942_c0_g1_i1.p1  ORF type:complete len:477 (+),score=127.00 TRINITY_DN65942_c0_g1_i1:68-1432(+)